MRGLGSGHVTCGQMRGLEINFTGRGHTYVHTYGHRDSMTESAQWADSLKSDNANNANTIGKVNNADKAKIVNNADNSENANNAYNASVQYWQC